MRGRLSMLALLGVLVLGTALPSQVRSMIHQAPPDTLERLLAPDGTLILSSGFRGALDARGWAMQTDPSGQPRFTPAAATQTRPAFTLEDAAWDSRFGVPGVDGAVYAVAISGTNVYVGGAFAVAGNVKANNIARWDGHHWFALGDGITADALSPKPVFAIAISSNDVYVGGSFSQAGGLDANNIARWDGRAWHPMGSGSTNGVGGQVRAIAISGRDVYVGGSFASAGGVRANRIAKWDGKKWSALGSGGANGVDQPVLALAVNEGSLYVGGQFTFAGGRSANRIARWDGGKWYALGRGLGDVPGYDTAQVAAIVVSGSEIYAAGRFRGAGDVDANNIARWDGSKWYTLGSGLELGPYNADVQALAVAGAELYAGGYFSTAGGQTASPIARWDGQSWHPLGGRIADSIQNIVHALASSGSDVYVGSSPVYPELAGTGSTNTIRRWSGGAWNFLSNDTTNGVDGSGIPAINGTIKTIVISGTEVYVGGRFTHVGALQANNIARWDGTRWSTLGSGLENESSPATVQALAFVGANLYAGGYFTLAGGKTARNIARWDGFAWSAIDDADEVIGPVTALAVSGQMLYVGGYFEIGDLVIDGVAQWDGTRWAVLGNGIANTEGVPPSVMALAASGDVVYVGGSFSMPVAGGQVARNIVRWDGNNWSALGNETFNGVDGWVHAIAVSGANVYVGGRFEMAGGVIANHIARWDGNGWAALGSGTSRESGPHLVMALAISGTSLYVGGSFSTAGGVPASNITRWDGKGWSSLGSGIEGRSPLRYDVTSLAASADSLYVGGDFNRAGGHPSFGFGRWLTMPIEYVFLPIAARH